MRQSGRACRLPVLLYHGVSPIDGRGSSPLSVSAKEFERQMRWLSHGGYVGIRSADWLGYLQGRFSLPEKPILLSFDDGYEDLATCALPVIRKYGFTATVFIVTRHLGGTNSWDDRRTFGSHRLMNLEQVHEWSTRGIEFGAHTRTHRDLRKLQPEELEDEIIGSAQDLSEILGTRVVSFAYPFGHFNAAVRGVARKAFSLAFTVNDGMNTVGTDPYLLRRTMIESCDTLADFVCRIRLGYQPIRYLVSRLGGGFIRDLL